MVTLWVWTNNFFLVFRVAVLGQRKIFNNIELHVLDILYSEKYGFFYYKVQCEALYTWNFTQSFYKIWCVACTTM